MPDALSTLVYRCRHLTLLVVALGLLVGGIPPLPAAAVHAQDGDTGVEPVDLLIVDETETFRGSLLVNLLAAGLKETGLFDIESVFVKVPSAFGDPLGENERGQLYEMILVIPRESELADVRQLWIVTCPLTVWTRREVWQGIETIKELVARRTQGQLEAVGVRDDALPGILATLFDRNGWLACGL